MAGDEVIVVAVLTAKPGKKERLIELLTALVNGVTASEPKTLQYELCLQEDSDDIVFVEKYADAAARTFHRSQPYFLETFRAGAEEELLAKEVELKVLTRVVGFGGRDASS